MTDNEMRIAIAEVCKTLPCPDCDGDGWTTGSEHHPSCDGSCVNCPVPVQIQCPTCGGSCTLGESLDYLNDLNAMHEAEKTLDFELSSAWMENLSIAVHGHWRHCTVNMMQATARQRAEAFLRTIGKWNE